MTPNRKVVLPTLLVGFLVSCSTMFTFAQGVDAQLRALALKTKIKQLIVDESKATMRLTLTVTMKGHVDVKTTFENLRPTVQPEARSAGLTEGDTLIVRINAETLTYSFSKAPAEAPVKASAAGALFTSPTRMVDAHTGLVDSILISSDAKTLITGSTDNTVKLWSLPETKLLATVLNGKKGAFHDGEMAISTDGRILASEAEKYSAKLWSVPEGRLLATLQGHTDYIRAVAITPDSKVVATGAQDSKVKLWAIPDGRLLNTLQGHTSYVNALTTTPDGKILVSGSSDGTIILWSLPDGQAIRTLTGHHGNVHTVAITPDGKLLASGSLDNTIKIWSLPEGQQISTLTGHTDWVNVVVIAPDGKTLASGAENIRVWSVADGRLLATLKGLGAPIRTLAFTPDGKMLISTQAGRLLFWDISSVLQ